MKRTRGGAVGKEELVMARAGREGTRSYGGDIEMGEGMGMGRGGRVVGKYFWRVQVCRGFQGGIGGNTVQVGRVEVFDGGRGCGGCTQGGWWMYHCTSVW